LLLSVGKGSWNHSKMAFGEIRLSIWFWCKEVKLFKWEHPSIWVGLFLVDYKGVKSNYFMEDLEIITRNYLQG
jgi:hypothetical protein